MDLNKKELDNLLKLLNSSDEKNIQLALSIIANIPTNEVIQEKLKSIFAKVYEDTYYYNKNHYSKGFEKYLIQYLSKYNLAKIAIDYNIERGKGNYTNEQILGIQGFRFIKTLKPLFDHYNLDSFTFFSFCKGSVPDLDLFQRLPQLQKISFEDAKPKYFKQLGTLTQLSELTIDKDHHKLAEVILPHLKTLYIFSATVSKAKGGFAFLDCCKDNLEDLTIGTVQRYNKIENDMIFPTMPKLKRLKLVSRAYYTPIIFQKLITLEELHIIGKIKFEFSLEGLEKLVNLKKLIIGGMKVKMDLSEFVKILPNLEYLYIHSDEYVIENQQLKKIEKIK